MTDDPVPRAITALVDEMFGGIPGVTVHKIGWTDDGSSKRVLDIHSTAWGPSLHSRHRRWVQNAVKAHERAVRIRTGEDAAAVDADLDSSLHVIPPQVRREAMELVPDDVAAVLRPCLERVAYVQRSLARTAAAHGITTPLPRPEGDPPLRDLRHLRIDRRLADLLAAHHGGEGAVARLRHALKRCLASDSGNTEGSIGAYDVSTNAQQHGVDAHMGTPAIWTLSTIGLTDAARIACGTSLPKEAATYDGMLLTIGDELPDTIVQACVGHPVMDVGETGVPSIDAAVIAEAYHDGEGRTCLELPFDEIAVTDHPAMGPALTRLVDAEAD